MDAVKASVYHGYRRPHVRACHHVAIVRHHLQMAVLDVHRQRHLRRRADQGRVRDAGLERRKILGLAPFLDANRLRYLVDRRSRGDHALVFFDALRHNLLELAHFFLRCTLAVPLGRHQPCPCVNGGHCHSRRLQHQRSQDIRFLIHHRPDNDAHCRLREREASEIVSVLTVLTVLCERRSRRSWWPLGARRISGAGAFAVSPVPAVAVIGIHCIGVTAIGMPVNGAPAMFPEYCGHC